jgi:hypothetical protein
MDRLTASIDPTSPLKGTVLQVQVLPGDHLGDAGAERAEAFGMIDWTGKHFPVTAGKHEYYAISIKLDSDWTPPLHNPANGNWQWGEFFQLHSPDQFGSPPAFAFSAVDRFSIQMLGGDLMADGVRRNTTTFPLTNGALNIGKWVEFMIDVIWAYDNSGSLTVLRRDEGETVFTPVLKQTELPTMQYNTQIADSQSATFKHYWRCGYYRSVSPGVTSRLRLGPIVRGTTLPEVEAAAFGASIVPKPPTALSILD